MANRFRQSFHNPVWFYQLNPQEIEQYVSRHIDTAPLRETLAPWQAKPRYAQPWQTTDAIRLQFQSNYAPATIKVIDGWEQVYQTIVVVQKQVNANDPTLHIYEVTVPLTDFANGTYFLRLDVGEAPGGGAVESFISDPLEILQAQPETLLLEYRQSRYAGETIFETGFAPSIRIKGHLSLESLSAKDTFFEDDELSQRLVDGRPYEVYELIIGHSGARGPVGIPDGLAKRLNRIFSLSNTLIDGKRYTKAGSDGLQPVDVKGYPLRAWTLKLRDTENKGGVTYDNDSVVLGPESYVISVDGKGFGAASSEQQIIDVQ